MSLFTRISNMFKRVSQAPVAHEPQGLQVSLEEIAEFLTSHQQFVISGHVNPDGDCLGSQLALAQALRALGKDVVCLKASSDPVPLGLSSIPGVKDLIEGADYAGPVEVFVTVDLPISKRLGASEAAFLRAKHTITIDHHEAPAPMSDLNYVDTKAPATAHLIWKLIKLLGVDITPDMARAAYTGLMTDTGCFQYQNTTSEAFIFASEMTEAGMNPAVVARDVLQNKSLASLRLTERMIAHAFIDLEQGVALSWLSLKDFEECGGVKADAEGLVDVLRGLSGIRVAGMLREEPCAIRGSLRAKDDTDVARIARQFNGGGHKAAAGLTYHGKLEQAVKDVTRALIKSQQKKDAADA